MVNKLIIRVKPACIIFIQHYTNHSHYSQHYIKYLKFIPDFAVHPSSLKHIQTIQDQFSITQETQTTQQYTNYAKPVCWSFCSGYHLIVSMHRFRSRSLMYTAPRKLFSPNTWSQTVTCSVRCRSSPSFILYCNWWNTCNGWIKSKKNTQFLWFANKLTESKNHTFV